ncbi:MAG: EF-P beta-lysylation protein EpmB, partial [Spirochaetia bacterium]|nr:EF-P beta-lysylation protein EpmB [Spirochaetia bacterium]
LASDETLSFVFEELANMPHLSTIRIHTRLPVFLPSRFTSELLGILQKNRLKRVLVAHVNHAAELDDESKKVFENLRAAGWTLLSQSVLLRGVNDKADILEDLSNRLFAQGVLPYYLHQLDRVSGSAHFEVPEAEGKDLIGELLARLPGYLVPRYVRESAGSANKLPIQR